MSDWIWALIIGFVLDLLLGDPAWLYHPVCLIGKYISWMEKKLRRRGGNLRKSAVFLTASTVLLTMAVVALILMLCGLLGRIPLLIAMALLDWMGIAITSMAKEARGVEKALGQGVAAGRTQVGYLDEKYRDIGWSSARLDDVLNYIPARLTALLMVIASYLIGLDGKNAFRIVRRDHANHKSPNCAWSESAAAGALHIQLGGTHNYFGKPVEKPTIGDADRPAERADIRRANRLLYTSSLLMMALIVLIAIVR